MMIWVIVLILKSPIKIDIFLQIFRLAALLVYLLLTPKYACQKVGNCLRYVFKENEKLLFNLFIINQTPGEVSHL